MAFAATGLIVSLSAATPSHAGGEVPAPTFDGPRTAARSPSQGELGRVESDLDADGRLDLIMFGSVLPRPGVTITAAFAFPNRGGGRLTRPRISELDSGPDNTAIGLFTPGRTNGDGIPDVVGVFVQFTPFLKNVVTYLGNGDGTFGRAIVASPQLDLDDAVHPLVLGDVTEDGRLDVIAQFEAQISVLPGDGDGTFGSPIHSGFSEAGHANTLVADFTGDGHQDLVTGVVTGGEDVSSSDIYLQEGAGNGTFEPIQVQTIDTNVNDAVTDDFNGDGAPDVAMIGDGGSNGGRAGLWVFLNQGGTLGPGVYYSRGQGGLEAGDMNLDGAVDLVSEDLKVNLNDGAGGFAQMIRVTGGQGINALGDYTQDSKPDMISILGSYPFGLGLFVNTTSP